MAGAEGGGLAAVAAAACSDAWQSGGGRVGAQAHVGRPGACAAAKAADRPAGARQGGLGWAPHREAHVGRLLALRLWWRVRFKVRGLRERGALRHPGERVARAVRGIHHDPPTVERPLLPARLSMGVNQRTFQQTSRGERHTHREEEERGMKVTCDQARGSPLARHSCRQRAPNVFSPL